MDVKNTKELIVLLAMGFQGYTASMKDGKLDAGDIAHLLPLVQAIGPAIQDINVIPAEVMDLEAKEMDELIAAVMENAPDLKTKAEALLRIRAVASLLVAAKDCYVVFTKPSVVPGVAIAANSFEGKAVEDGSMRAALRADAQGSAENKEEAEKKREAILAARELKEKRAAAVAAGAPQAAGVPVVPGIEQGDAPPVAEVVAEAAAAGEPKASV